MRAIWLTVSRLLLLACLVAAPASAEVVRVEVQSRSDLVGGQPFGAAGAYEKICGQDFLRRRSVAAGQPYRDRHRQGPAQRRR